MEQYALQFLPVHRVYGVSELNAAIRDTLGEEYGDIRVSGEISGMRMATSGHCYFSLKERDSQIRCVCFRSTYRYLKFKPKDGILVIARGRIDVFEARGEYQLLVEVLEPQGAGALQIAFEQLKQKLKDEGLFEAARKRPLPLYPRRIGMVTSPAGAVVSDMLRVLERRFPGLHIRLFPAQVQGEGSIEDVCRGLEYFSARRWADLVIVARGGGSIEDLWTFNTEAVARAIAACSVPVVSAIGHETDVTIADFVADLRAPTPSAAAEMICCTRQELVDRIEGCRKKMVQLERYRLALLQNRLRDRGVEQASRLLHRRVGRLLQQVDEKQYRLRERMRRILDAAARRQRALEAKLREHDLRPRLARDRRRLDAAQAAMLRVMPLEIARKRQALETARAKLEQLSPLAILDRGYAIVSNESGIVREPAQAPEGSEIRVRLRAGSLKAEVR